MKRFHVHAHVEDLDKSIAFYSRLFGAAPSKVQPGYAKWMIEDPRLNFAISSGGSKVGINHLGIQTDSDEELAALQARADAADLPVAVEGEVNCCYARSRKHWVTDPQGIAWEHFHTLADIPVFGGGAAEKASPSGSKTIAVRAAPACCGA